MISITEEITMKIITTGKNGHLSNLTVVEFYAVIYKTRIKIGSMNTQDRRNVLGSNDLQAPILDSFFPGNMRATVPVPSLMRSYGFTKQNKMGLNHF